MDELAPVILDSDISHLPTEDQEVADLLVQASDYIGAAFLRQVYEGNEAILEELEVYIGTEMSVQAKVQEVSP